MENGSKLMKIKYTCDENGNVCLGDIVEVRVTYEEVVEVSNTASTTEVEEVGVENATEIEKEDEEEKVEDETPEKDEEVEDEKEDDFETPSEDEEEEKEVTEKESTKEPSEDEEEEKDDEVAHAACGYPEEEEKEKSTATDAADVSNAEVTETERVMSDEHEQIEETNTGSASFTQSERAEFEALKREKKVNLLNSYKEILSEEEFNNFLGSIDSFEEKDLEIELLKAYKASKDHEPKQQRAFAFAPILNKKNAEKDSLDNFIRNNL
jgi:hypothetical protein